MRATIPIAQTIVLDLSDVQSWIAPGLGALVSIYVTTKRAGKRLQLVNLSGRVQELLRITKLLSVFEGIRRVSVGAVGFGLLLLCAIGWVPQLP